MLVLKLHDGKTPRKMSDRDDFKLAARSLAVLRHQEGKEHPKILKSKREKQIPLDESCDPNLNGRVRIIGNFMDRRHHLHIRQPGGDHKNGKIQKDYMNGKDTKHGMVGENGKKKYIIFESSFYIPLESERTICQFFVVKHLNIRGLFFCQGVSLAGNCDSLTHSTRACTRDSCARLFINSRMW